jgi:hypothetical protein
MDAYKMQKKRANFLYESVFMKQLMTVIVIVFTATSGDLTLFLF